MSRPIRHKTTGVYYLRTQVQSDLRTVFRHNLVRREISGIES